jgi:hypothetical protein
VALHPPHHSPRRRPPRSRLESARRRPPRAAGLALLTATVVPGPEVVVEVLRPDAGKTVGVVLVTTLLAAAALLVVTVASIPKDY